MKASLLMFALVAGLLLTAPLCAATLEWTVVLGTSSPPVDVSVDQVVADGSGGCVIVWNEYNNGTHHNLAFMMRLNKKGVAVWANNTTQTLDVELGMVDKNNVVASITPETGDEYTLVVDKKGLIGTLQEAGADVLCDMNGETGPTGDKKGFFVVVKRGSGEVVLQRFSFK